MVKKIRLIDEKTQLMKEISIASLERLKEYKFIFKKELRHANKNLFNQDYIDIISDIINVIENNIIRKKKK